MKGIELRLFIEEQKTNDGIQFDVSIIRPQKNTLDTKIYEARVLRSDIEIVQSTVDLEKHIRKHTIHRVFDSFLEDLLK